MRRTFVGLVAGLLLATGCTAPQEAADEPAPTGTNATTDGTPAAGPTGGATAAATPAPTTAPSPAPVPARFDSARAMRDVRRLAGDIGPRLATGAGFRQATRLVARRFEELGYDVRTPAFDVPAGDSWGVAVPAGRSRNVVALPSGFRFDRPYRLVGAHLDTVAVSPGAEDNASGVAVLLELARLAAAHPTALPTVLVAFGAEEPRGPTDADHHYGSRFHVRRMSGPARENLRAMVAIDRVGVAGPVPVCTGGRSPLRVRDDLLASARRLGVPAEPCRLTTSDHWSFEKAGFTVARLGSRPYAAYHSERDLPGVVARDQLARTGRLAWAWLRR